MGIRQREWAKRARAMLVVAMGGACEKCGSRAYSELEFDHIGERTWDAAKVSSSHRISIYRREFSEGKLRLLCRTCNAQDGANRVNLKNRLRKAEREYERRLQEREEDRLAEIAAEIAADTSDPPF